VADGPGLGPHLMFAEAFLYPDDPSGITMPVVLIYGGKAIRISAKVDTGAAVCLFSHEDGLKLGLPVTQGMPIVLSSLAGPLEAFGHEVTLQTGTLAFQSLGTSRSIQGCRATASDARDGYAILD
jgi:hypothetical protein